MLCTTFHTANTHPVTIQQDVNMSGSSQHDVRSNIRMAFVSEEHIKKSALNRGQKITRTQNEFGVFNRSNNIILIAIKMALHHQGFLPNLLGVKEEALCITASYSHTLLAAL